MSPPFTAFLEAATVLPLDELVSVADFLVLEPRILDPQDVRPHLSLADLRLGVARSRGRGAAQARAAAELSRQGVESPRETALRLMLHRALIPEPECGFALVRPGGRVIGWFDLAWPQWQVIAEYDGDQHRTSRTQYERDIRRFDDAADLGWKVIRVRDQGIRNPRDTVARVTSALASRGWGAERSNKQPPGGVNLRD